MGRFVSADSQINPEIMGTNIFAYCINNPVNYLDRNGKYITNFNSGYGWSNEEYMPLEQYETYVDTGWSDEHYEPISLLHKPTDSTLYNSEYGDPTRSKFHNGLDIAPQVGGVAGDLIYVIANGRIKEVGRNSKDSRGYYVILITDNGYTVTYMHLRAIALVQKDARVKEGQVIGYMGTTGFSTGVHLHIEIQKNGNYINPFNVYPGVYSPNPLAY